MMYKFVLLFSYLYIYIANPVIDLSLDRLHSIEDSYRFYVHTFFNFLRISLYNFIACKNIVLLKSIEYNCLVWQEM